MLKINLLFDSIGAHCVWQGLPPKSSHAPPATKGVTSRRLELRLRAGHTIKSSALRLVRPPSILVSTQPLFLDNAKRATSTWVSPEIRATSARTPVLSVPPTARSGNSSWAVSLPTLVSDPSAFTLFAPEVAILSSVLSVSSQVTTHGALRVSLARPVSWAWLSTPPTTNLSVPTLSPRLLLFRSMLLLSANGTRLNTARLSARRRERRLRRKPPRSGQASLSANSLPDRALPKLSLPLNLNSVLVDSTLVFRHAQDRVAVLMVIFLKARSWRSTSAECKRGSKGNKVCGL